jgi:hypothetical protein
MTRSDVIEAARTLHRAAKAIREIRAVDNDRTGAVAAWLERMPQKDDAARRASGEGARA